MTFAGVIQKLYSGRSSEVYPASFNKAFEQNLFNMFPSDGFGHRNINFNNENDPEHISNFSQSFSSYSYTDENGDIITKTQNRENNNGKVRESSKEYINNKEVDSTGSKLKYAENWLSR